MAEKIIYTNTRGQSIELTNRRPFLLESVEGKGDVEANLQMQSAPYQEGSTFIDSLMVTRSVSLQGAILAESRDDLLRKRQHLASIFNPKLGPGRLIYENGNTKREIGCVPEHVPNFPVGSGNKGLTYQRTLINLLCPSPFWEDVVEENYKLEDFVGSFKFPFHLPTRFSTRGDSKVLINYGDVPTPITVEFRGPVINPVITNQTTGEFIRINREIPTGYKLILDTAFGSKRVDIIAPDGTTTNGFHYIDLASTFFDLDIGDNQIGFVAAGGSPEVYVKYKQRYLSV